MRIRDWLVPQDKIFFDLLKKQSFTALKGAEKLLEMVKNVDSRQSQVKKIKDIEHEGDQIIKEIFVELNKTFITPIDKEDIVLLASKLDDILDFVYASANRIYLYKVKPDGAMLALSNVIVKSAKKLNTAMIHLGSMKNAALIEECRLEVNKLENEADEILNEALAKLFKGRNPIKIMKNKEIIEFLEFATDSCEDAANVIGDVLLKHR